MANEIRLTIRELGESIQRQFGGRLIPDWKLRRVVDDLEQADTLNVQRVGRYRTVSAADVETIADELRRLDWLTTAAPIDADSLAVREGKSSGADATRLTKNERVRMPKPAAGSPIIPRTILPPR